MAKTVGDVLTAIRETHEAIARADKLLDRIARGAPKALGLLAEDTERLRDMLIVEVDSLEAKVREMDL